MIKFRCQECAARREALRLIWSHIHAAWHARHNERRAQRELSDQVWSHLQQAFYPDKDSQ